MTALNAGDLSQAWFEIRYGSNAGWSSHTKANIGVAKRRYLESQLFSLSQPGDTYVQALQAYETLAANRPTILTYEQLYGTDPDGPNPNVYTSQSALGMASEEAANRVPAIQAPADPVQTLTQAFDPEADLLVNYLDSLYGAVLPQIGIQYDSNSGGGTFQVLSTDILVAPTEQDVDEGFATAAQFDVDASVSDPGPYGILSPGLDHIIVGTGSGDILTGGLAACRT